MYRRKILEIELTSFREFSSNSQKFSSVTFLKDTFPNREKEPIIWIRDLKCSNMTGQIELKWTRQCPKCPEVSPIFYVIFWWLNAEILLTAVERKYLCKPPKSQVKWTSLFMCSAARRKRLHPVNFEKNSSIIKSVDFNEIKLRSKTKR